MDCVDRTTDFHKVVKSIKSSDFSEGNRAFNVESANSTVSSAFFKFSSSSASTESVSTPLEDQPLRISQSGLRFRQKEGFGASSNLQAFGHFNDGGGGFTELSSGLSADCNELLCMGEGKIDELKKLSKKSGIYQDHSAKIEELTVEVKEILNEVSSKLKILEGNKIEATHTNSQSQTHLKNMISTIKSRWMTLGENFKSALLLRSEILKKHGDRKNFYSRVDFDYKSRSAYSPLLDNDVGASNCEHTDIERGLTQAQIHGGKWNTIYATSRRDALDNVQKVLQDLAQIFQKTAMLVNEQEEMVLRIDDNTLNASNNVSQGHQNILLYLSRMTSNRSLILKIFGALIMLIILASLFLP